MSYADYTRHRPEEPAEAIQDWAARFAPGATVDHERGEVRFASFEDLRKALPFESPLRPGELREIDLGEFVVTAEESQ